MIKMTALSESTSTHFTGEARAELDPKRLPRHVAIVMDGNRRWARKQDPLKFTSGHWQGAEVVDTIVEGALEIGLEQLTLYAFSTENWKRTPFEVATLQKVLDWYLDEKCEKMVKMGVHFQTIGDLTPFKPETKEKIAHVAAATAQNSQLTLTLALNYGGRDEICRACNALAQKVASGEVEHIDETLFAQHLDTAQLHPLDLFIRTSGEQRVSNFLLWQLSYAELFVSEKLWPDFTPHDLLDAVLVYQRRERREGR